MTIFTRLAAIAGISIACLAANSQVQAQSKRMFPWLKGASPTYVKSEEGFTKKLRADSIDYQYQHTYKFPTLQVEVTVYCAMNASVTGIMISTDKGLALGNKGFKFVSQVEDLPKTIEAADLNGDGHMDFIVRMRNNFGSDFAKNIYTTLYMVKKKDSPTYQGLVSGSFFPWKEYDVNKDGQYEIINITTSALASENVFVANVFNIEANSWKNVSKQIKGYPKFYRTNLIDPAMPRKRRKVKEETVPFYLQANPVVTYKEQ